MRASLFGVLVVVISLILLIREVNRVLGNSCFQHRLTGHEISSFCSVH